jgi:hypothetical protein
VPRVSESALRALRALALAASAGFGALYVAVAVSRMRYPFELEWMEGGMLDHVGRVLRGLPIYARPSLDFVSYLYPPLYYVAAAGVSWLLGPGFFPLRLLSFASSIAVASLLFGMARRETGDLVAAVAAAGLYVALFDRSGGWFDLARLDSFYMALLLAGAAVLQRAATSPAAAAAGIPFAAAFLTKQSALVVFAPVAVWAVLADRRRGAWFAAMAVGAAGAAVLLLQLETQGWFGYYCFTLPAHHPRVPGGALAFWTSDMAPLAPACLLAAAGVWLVSRRPGGAGRFFVPSLAAGLLASSWSVRSMVGAETNNLLPAFAAIALLAAIGAHAAARRGPAPGAVAWLAIVVQLALLVYAPGHDIPTRADRAAGERLVARLAALPGEVFVPHHGYLAVLAGKRSFAHTLAIDNVLLDDPGPVREELAREMTRALAEHRFSAVLLESDGRYAKTILRDYEVEERLFADPSVFWPVTGGRLRPEFLCVPRLPSGVKGE